ncbi:MAG: CBS domain-containing protein [Oceanicoccus sp.]|jgi:acetoin utilization protein AcuB
MFYMIEQGARIHTPVDKLLTANRQVNAVAASTPSHAVAADNAGGANLSTAKVNRKQPGQQETGAYQQQSAGDTVPVVFAHQIMSSPPITALTTASIEDIWQVFSQRGIHHLPLLDPQQRLQGIVSDRDLLRFAANEQRNIGQLTVSGVMTSPVISAAAEVEIRLLAEVMCSRAIGAIPITDDQSMVVGIVSRSDILRTLVNRAPLELWA